MTEAFVQEALKNLRLIIDEKSTSGDITTMKFKLIGIPQIDVSMAIQLSFDRIAWLGDGLQGGHMADDGNSIGLYVGRNQTKGSEQKVNGSWTFNENMTNLLSSETRFRMWIDPDGDYSRFEPTYDFPISSALPNLQHGFNYQEVEVGDTVSGYLPAPSFPALIDDTYFEFRNSPTIAKFTTKQTLRTAPNVQFTVLKEFDYAEYSFALVPSTALGSELVSVSDGTTSMDTIPLPVTATGNGSQLMELVIPDNYPKEERNVEIGLKKRSTNEFVPIAPFIIETERTYPDDVVTVDEELLGAMQLEVRATIPFNGGTIVRFRVTNIPNVAMPLSASVIFDKQIGNVNKGEVLTGLMSDSGNALGVLIPAGSGGSRDIAGDWFFHDGFLPSLTADETAFRVTIDPNGEHGGSPQSEKVFTSPVTSDFPHLDHGVFTNQLGENKIIAQLDPPPAPPRIHSFTIAQLSKYVVGQNLSFRVDISGATSAIIKHGPVGSRTKTETLTKFLGRDVLKTFVPKTPGTAPFDYELVLEAKNDNGQAATEAIELTVHRDVVSPMNFYRFTMISRDPSTGHYYFSNITPRRVIHETKEALEFFEKLGAFIVESDRRQIELYTYNNPVDSTYPDGYHKLVLTSPEDANPLETITATLEEVYAALLASGVGGIEIEGVNTATSDGTSSDNSGTES